MNSIITCLMATYGRSHEVSTALSCFVAQRGDFDATLVIHNNHPTPMTFAEASGAKTTQRTYGGNRHVVIVNESGLATLGDVRNAMLARVESPFVRTWDDDDFYLPWSLADGVKTMQDEPKFPAYKPYGSWFWTPKELTLSRNAMEASMTVRTDIARRYGYKSASGGDEHSALLQGIWESGGTLECDRGWKTGYAYRWGWGGWHISGSLGADTVQNRTNVWYTKHNDTTLYSCMDIRPLDEMLASFVAATPYEVARKEVLAMLETDEC